MDLTENKRAVDAFTYERVHLGIHLRSSSPPC